MKDIIAAIEKEIADAERESSLRDGKSAQRGALLVVKLDALRKLLKHALFIRTLEGGE